MNNSPLLMQADLIGKSVTWFARVDMFPSHDILREGVVVGVDEDVLWIKNEYGYLTKDRSDVELAQ